MNYSYMRIAFRHIGFGLALHAGWNLTRFSGDFIYQDEVMHEGATFNLLEGSGYLATLLLFILCAWLLRSIFIAKRTHPAKVGAVN